MTFQKQQYKKHDVPKNNITKNMTFEETIAKRYYFENNTFIHAYLHV